MELPVERALELGGVAREQRLLGVRRLDLVDPRLQPALGQRGGRVEAREARDERDELT